MPNHVKNVWKISHIPQDKLQYVLDKITMIYDHDMRIIDFDLIIPEPRLKKDCPADCIVNKDSHVAEIKDRPWFDWYAWHNKYWNTKWNAYDGTTEYGKTWIRLIFSTAWSFPTPIARKLADLGYDLDIKWADEDLGNNCGRISYDAEEDAWTTYDNWELGKSTTEFARNLWSRY